MIWALFALIRICQQANIDAHQTSPLEVQIALPNNYSTILVASLENLLPTQHIKGVAATAWVYSNLVVNYLPPDDDRLRLPLRRIKYRA